LLVVGFKQLRGVRASAEGRRVSTFELFFDLVYVFAFTQVTRLMSQEDTAFGVLQGLIILGLLWWSWVSFSWLSNYLHADEGIMRLGMIVAMTAVFITALAIPEAFDDLTGGLSGPLVLAVAYTVVRLTQLGLYTVSARADKEPRQQLVSSSSAALLGSGFIVTGALIGGQAQTWFWLAGLLTDFALTYATSVTGNWQIRSAVHWTERYSLIVMLALGESIIALGFGASELPIDAAILTGSVFGVGLSICLWWLYFDMTALEAERIFGRLEGRERASMATDAYTYLHLVMVTGIIFFALGVETTLEHIDDSTRFGWFGAIHLVGGTAIYLIGHALFWRRISGQWKKARVVTSLILVALVPVGAFIPPLAAMALTFAVCCALVAYETKMYADHRATLRRED
jgi:low temperature requirement protein LtrA